MRKTPSMSREPGAEEMLTWALDWLNNCRAAMGQEPFLDTMPNNMLGVSAMRERLEEIQAAPISQPYCVLAMDTKLQATVVGPFATEADAAAWQRDKEAGQVSAEVQYLTLPMVPAAGGTSQRVGATSQRPRMTPQAVVLEHQKGKHAQPVPGCRPCEVEQLGLPRPRA
jgi:hypothetical protein